MNPDLYQELVRQISSLQKQVDGLIKPEVGRWIDWTPTITQGVAVTRNINLAKYSVSDNVVNAIVILGITSAGTGGQIIHIAGIPTSIAPTIGALLGIGMVLDSGTAFYVGGIYANGADDLIIYAHNAGTAIGSTPSFALANGDAIYLNMMWNI